MKWVSLLTKGAALAVGSAKIDEAILKVTSKHTTQC